MTGYTERIAALITEGIEEGVFRQDTRAEDSARYLIALFQGLMMRWSIFDFSLSIDTESEPLWQFFSSSLKPD